MGKTISTKISSKRKLNLGKFTDEKQKRLSAHLYKEAEGIMTAAKELVPVDTGTLRDSGFVEKPKGGKNGGIEVTLGFGGAAKLYALKVHEDMDAHHTVGGPKYLETPYKKALEGMHQRIRDAVKK